MEAEKSLILCIVAPCGAGITLRMMRKTFIAIALALVTCVAAKAQTVLANFDDINLVTIDTTATLAKLFSQMPAIVDNPDKSGLNTSAKCLGAVNVANADWNGNFINIRLNTPVLITRANCCLSMLMYRSVQAKRCRIGFNGTGDDQEIYCEKLANTKQWERIVVDMSSRLGQTLSELWVVLSCNWDVPRRGWGEATYCFDDITLSSAVLVPDANVVVDASRQYQTIHHFGASDAWTMDFVGRYWSTAECNKAARKLFSQKLDANGSPEGIGLSGWRFNLGAGSATQGDDSNIDLVKRTECFLNADGTYDWSRQAGQQYFMGKALEAGCEHFILFSNSAPIHMTRNGMAHANGSGQCNLTHDKMPAFAEFLVTSAEHFKSKGYNVSLISPVNEPQYDWGGGQEGSPWENIDIANLARAIDQSMTNHNTSGTHILLTEAGQYDRMFGGSGRASNQISQLYNSLVPNTYIGDLTHLAPYVAGHSYWTYKSNHSLKDARMRLLEAADAVGIGTMQTEFSFLEVPEQGTGFPSSAGYIDYALYLAKVIHSDLVYANVSAWNFWTTMAQEQYSQANRFFLMRLRPVGGDYGSLLEGGTIDDNKNLWALGNYSFFLRPGFRRVNLTGGDEMNHVLASAWLAPDSSQLVIVYINTASQRRFSKVTLRGLNREVTGIRKYVTSSVGNLSLSESESSLDQIVLGARSVNTVVIDLRSSTPTVPGDVNGDGVVDINDVNQCINAILGIGTAADVTGDGVVDIADVNAIINIILG